MNAATQAIELQRREAAVQWLLRLSEGPIPLEQQVEFELWIDEDPRNLAAFQQLAMTWRKTAELAGLPELTAVRRDALEAFHGTGNRHGSMRIATRLLPILAAAACLLLIVAGGLHLLHGQGESYRTGVGERRLVTLDDGSRISLDASTTVDVKYSAERRALRLQAGRAKFDVAKDPRRPFTVSAGGRMVVATGTAFSVELLHTQVRIVLYEGAVAVLEDGPGDRPPRHLDLAARNVAADTALKPGTVMIAALDRPLARVEQTDPIRSLSWEGGQLNFTDEPLALAAERMNRYSREKIVIDDPATGRLPVSGAFNAGDTEAFVDGVSALYPLRATRGDNSITLVSAPS